MAQQTPFPQADRGAVAAFVNCLFRYADENAWVNLRAFHDLRDSVPPLFVEPIKIGAPNFIERVCERIHEAAAHPEPHVFCPPVCVFAKPNGAAAENLAEGIALSVECDANPYAALKKLTAILGKPTAVVASGGMWKNPETGRFEKKLHGHWRFVEPTRSAEEHERLREARALAAEIAGADKTAVSPVHPLRWPGSWHRKTQTPRLVTLTVNPDAEIELGEALDRLREACPTKPPPAGNGHDRDEEGRDLRAPLPELEAAIGITPNNATWDEWNRIGMALWVASNGQGFDAFDAWSKKHPKYDERNTKLRWNHYYQSPPSRIGAGTVFHLASQADADWRSKIKTPEAPDWQKKELEKSNQALAEQERALAEQKRIDELARMSRVEYDRKRKTAAADLKIRTKTLDDEVEKRRRQPGAKPSLQPDKTEALKKTAGDLVQEPDILDRFGKAVQKRGLIGETNNAKILYLTLTSRLFERPVSVVIKGVSSGGKSFTVETVLGYFPDEAFFARTGMSEHALPYSEEDFQHRHVVVYEAVGLDSETASYFIRTLLSENRICYETVEKTSEGLKSRVIKKDGPTGLITTTTATALHPENETRLLSLGVIDSPEQTKAVMRSLANRAAGGQLSEDDHPAWQAFQQWLAAGERRVVVPYAAVLAEHVPPAAVRLRRDFATLMSLIAANALLHRDLRPKDDKGRIQATVRDYEVVQGLVATLFAEGVEATVPPTVRTTVEAVKTIGSSEVSIAALAKHLGLDKSSVRSRIRKAIDRGYLTNNEPKQGLPARITLGDPLPNETQILPSPDVLRGDPGGEGHETGGISPRDTESNEAVSGKAENLGKSPGSDPKSAFEAEKSTEKASKSAENPYCASVAPGGVAGEPYPPDLAPLTPSPPSQPDPEEAP